MTNDESQAMDQTQTDTGQGRPLCGASAPKPEDPDHTCELTAGHGTDHLGIGTCKFHLGSTANHVKAAQKEQALRDVKLFGARRDVHPGEALLELVQWTAGECDYWRERVRQVEQADLTWGVTRVKSGGEDRGTTEEAKPHITYAMLVDASKRLESHCSAALRAGIEERRVQLAEDQGRMLAGVITRILAGMFDALVAGLGDFEQARILLEQMWGQLVGQIVPAELRAIAVASEVVPA